MESVNEYNYYELQKKVQQLRRKIQLAEYSNQVKPLKEKFKDLKKLQVDLCKNVNEITESVSEFNENKLDVEKKLLSPNFLNVPRNSAAYLKDVKTEAVEILANPVKEPEVPLEILPENQTENDADKNFLFAMDRSLLQRKEFNVNTACFVANVKDIFGVTKHSDDCESNGSSSFHSDDTLRTIISDNVFASSPI